MNAAISAAVYLISGAGCLIFGIGNLARRWEVTSTVLAAATVLAIAVIIVGLSGPPPRAVRMATGIATATGAVLLGVAARGRYHREFRRVAPSLVFPSSQKG